MDFADIVKRTEADETDYLARINSKGTDGFKELPSLFVKTIDKGKRQIEAVVSDASLDREDEIIIPEAFRESLASYLKNPVILSSHQHRLETGHSSVVGQCVRAWIDAEGLHVVIQFAETELGNEYWYLYSNKYQRAFSVGFIPQDYGYEEREGNRILVHKRLELLEISCVPVPANRNALSKSKQRKAVFLADKIAQRQAEKDADETDAFGLIGFSRRDFSEEELAGMSEDELAVLDSCIDISIREDSGPEPDYAQLVKSEDSSGQEFYQE